MIHTAVTKLLGIQVPIIQGGMIWASGWPLASAVSRAGGLGLLGAGSMTPELLTRHVTKAQLACREPVGVNVPVTSPQAEELVAICVAKRVPVVFTSAGSPRKYTRRLQANGIRVVHVAPSVALAKKVAAAGCDAVVAEGTEAGGHNGFEEITSMNLWPAVVDAVGIPVIGAGGIADGRGLAAALALGCQGVQLGTRFAATFESSASDAYKQAILDADEGQARLVLRNFLPIRALENEFLARLRKAELRGQPTEDLWRLRGTGRARRGIFEGDLEEGELEAGQVAGRLGALLSAEELVGRLVQEYLKVSNNLP
jgi:enoyl-[acyl-carrier protein] reductase II